MVLKARLDLFIGSMYSGKSSALLRKLTQLSDLKFSVIWIRPDTDTRDYSTHSSLIAKNLALDTVKISKHCDYDFELLKGYDVIGIDEAQFFGVELIDFVKTLVDHHKKYVVVAGLDGDFSRNKFGHVLDLIPLCDNVVKLHAFCKSCREKGLLETAIFTRRHSTNDDQVVVGGIETYEAVCRDCYCASQRT